MEIIPLEKLITRLKTDLHLAQKYRDDLPNGYPGPDAKVDRKNQRKFSMLHYLEELKMLKDGK